ncbi:MAG: cation:proton antiporter [Alphaproteobacteria bacterium]|nr:cation:proton antiporter [Alphaproteobacteria bacterium]
MFRSELAAKLFFSPDFASPNILFVFGLFLILGVLGATLTHRVRWLPSISAFMLIGFLIGPSGANLITADILHKSQIIIDVALGLILYNLGADVQLRHLLRSTPIWRSALVEASLSFIIIFLAAVACGIGTLVAAFVAAIGVSSSPAVLVHTANEMRARGPIVYHAKALVTLNNVLAFFIFSLLLPIALGEKKVNILDMVGIPLYRAAGAALVGFVVALVMERMDRFLNKEDQHFRFALIVGGITTTLGLADMFGISSLFAALTLGIATRWLETQRQGLSNIEFGASGDMFFIALFAMAGANLHVQNLAVVGLAASAAILARFVAKAASLVMNRRRSEHNRKQITAVSLMLMPLGGLAIGLAQTLQTFAPETGSKVALVVFSMVAVLETLGPFFVSGAIKISGESPLYPKASQEPKENEENQKPEDAALLPSAPSN